MNDFFLHVVADYAAGDLAFSEMVSALVRHLPPFCRWHLTPIASFDTLSTGFVVAQLGLQEEALRPTRLLIYANCAPRQDERRARADNAGEELVYVRLDNEVEILAVNSGYSLSFVRDHIVDLRALELANSGSQFRSRDLFPEVVGEIVRGEHDRLRDRLSLRSIPDLPQPCVAYRDSFENLKTSWRQGDLPLETLQPGQRIHLTLAGIRREAVVASGSFAVDEGEIAFAPGSSGQDRPYWEIFQRGGSAWQCFGCPPVGTAVEFSRS